MTARRRKLYLGDGDGAWHGDWYVYRPSPADRTLAQRVATKTAERVTAARRLRTGYGDRAEARASWYVTGFLGEVAALHPFGAGPDLAAWDGARGWFGSPDYHGLEVRTTSSWQLYGFALAGRQVGGLGGWRITAKDRGRILVCVEERELDYAVLGCAREADVPRLETPLGSIIAVVSPDELWPLWRIVPELEEVAL